MNPLDRFKIDNYKEILIEIEKIGRLEHLKDLEDRIICEIASLVHDGSEAAKIKLQKLENVLEEDLDFKPRNPLLFSALKKSISGALSAAKFYLL